ncbi:uncharacterized protein [Diadema setosum]|uniref:uncharacterized protein n=1 Tax=Diadema setosum TaxID=31175 RepID=UPI003B3A7E63
MGCSAGKNPPLDRIPSSTSASDVRAKENGHHTVTAKGDSNNAAVIPSKASLERRDTGDFSSGLVNGNHGNQRHQEGNSLIDLSSVKRHKEMPLSGPIYNNNREVSKSQSDFFKMLDEKIEQGHYDPDDET